MKTVLKRPVTIIYHGNCPDGFAAALAIKLYFKKKHLHKKSKELIYYHEGKHGELPPECRDNDIYIVDFSYKRDMVKQLCEQANKVTIIDHHVSAMKDLEGLDEDYDNLNLVFDMTQSGAVLSWKYFHDAPVPKLFKHIQDNDLWQFKLKHTRTIIKAMMSYPLKFKLWTSWLEDKNSLKQLHQEGHILQRQMDRQIKRYKRAARMGNIAGYRVPIVNAPASLGSELLHQLSDGYPFAAAYEDKPEKRTWQLRSGGKKAIDVSEIARQFGGGGHKNASGFSTRTFDIDLPIE
jgi:oligoribonuclease NrnB/cAMP/cGMP phosphodiesterase (DHH superfamily)